MYILRRAALRALSSPATSSIAYSSVSTTSRSFVSVSTASLRTSLNRPTCILPSLQIRFKSDDATAASQEGEDVKVVKEEVTETPQEIQEAVQGSETSAPADPEITATEGKTMSHVGSSESAGQPVAPEETTQDTHAASPSAQSMSQGAGVPSRTRESREEPAPSTSLYVGNLFFETTDASLRNEFSKFGDVQSTKIIYDFRGLSKGFGYVTFNTVEEATRAKEAMNLQEFQGRRLTVNFQINKGDRAQRSGDRSGDRPQRGLNEPSKTLFVGNMSYEMSDKDLSDLFRQCTNVVDVRVAIDRNTGSPRGFAHADFTDVESAMAARNLLNSKEVYGRQLKVDYSSSTPRTSSPQGGDRSRRDNYERGPRRDNYRRNDRERDQSERRRPEY